MTVSLKIIYLLSVTSLLGLLPNSFHLKLNHMLDPALLETVCLGTWFFVDRFPIFQNIVPFPYVLTPNL